MDDSHTFPQPPFDDGLGPDAIDRGSGKELGPGGSGGGGHFIDPSYEDALRILDRAFMIPSPFQQRPMMMDDRQGALLAGKLTELRGFSGFSLGVGTTNETQDGALPPPAREKVDAFIAALQENPADPARLAQMRQELAGAGSEVETLLDEICGFPGVEEKFSAP